MWLLVVLAVLVVLAAAYAAWIAARIRRLEARVDSAWRALDTALLARAEAAVALAHVSHDPELAAAADGALADPTGRTAAENALSRALGRSVVPAELLDHFGREAAKVRLARQFHNDAVRDLRSLRGRPLVRVLGVGGGRVLPDFFEVDDAAQPHPGPLPAQVRPADDPERAPDTLRPAVSSRMHGFGP